jgi:hypothetical protein
MKKKENEEEGMESSNASFHKKCTSADIYYFF